MIKNLLKRRIALLLALFMVIGLVPFGTLAESIGRSEPTRAAIDPGVSGLTASYDTGTWSTNSTQHSINGSVKTSSSTSCGETTYTPQTGTLTLTNSSGGTATLTFTAAPELNDGSVKINGTDCEPGGYTFVLANNNSVSIVITSSAQAENTTSISLTNIGLAVERDVTITFTPAENGSYTVDGIPVTSNVTLTKKSTESFVVSATAASGYRFAGWIVGDDSSNVISTNASDSLTFTENTTISAYFIDDSIAVFDVAGRSFYSLTSAVTYAQANSKSKITLVSNGTLQAGSYTIPSGITLLIPFDVGQTVYTSTPPILYNEYTTPTAFRTLTMASGASITVKNGGAICLSGKLSSKGQMGGYNGTPTGPDGRICMMTGSSITLESGANLYCWGYIYGSGDVEAKSGSTVYEAFQVKDWRGGSATLNVKDYAFIFNQYYIQNVEVALKVNQGATLKLYSSLNASSKAYPIGATLIGSGGMFQISSGYIVKDYNESKDQLNVGVYGNVTVNPLVITDTPAGDVSTANFCLPINNMNIDIQSGTVSMVQDLEFLPCAEVTVARGATFEVSSGKKVYLYDESDWDKFTGTARLYPVGYSVANGTTAIRTEANLKDARINVNGTVNVKGSLFTSEHGADITSSEGLNGTNGKFVFTTAPTASTTIYECYNNSTQTTVNFYAPKLHNGDDSYSLTAGTGTSTWKYDKDGEHWYRFIVDFMYNNKLIQRDFFCENNDTVTYDASWLSNVGATASNGTATVSGTNVNVTGVTADCVVTLAGAAAEYIPTFVLNEKQYSIYQLYTGNTISNTTTIDDETYYIIDQASTALAVGTEYAAPSNAAMGVTAANHNSITWNLSGGSYTSGDPYRGIVPVGETPQGPVYIFGFYDGVIAYNSYTDGYYKTLIDAFADTPSDATTTITLLADCGTFEDELPTQAYSSYPANNITLDLNGHNAVGRIINQGTLTLELNGGTWNYTTGATAAAAVYQGMAAIINSGNMTVTDSVGGGRITADAISNAGVPNHSAVIRNFNGGTLSVSNVTLENLQDVNSYVSIVLNDRATITSMTDVTILSPRGYAVFNYGGQIQLIDSCTIDCAYGIYNRNVRGTNTIAQGYNIANYGTIGIIKDSTITAGQYALNNSATINELNNCTFTAHPDSAQVNTYGTTAANVHGNTQCYTVFNSGNWWYDTNVWKQVDSGLVRTYTYKEDEAYRPTIGTITDCNVYAENTSTSADYGYALYNAGVINEISGTTQIKTYKHPDNAKITASNYALLNTTGGIIKSITGSVTVNASNRALQNSGVFTTILVRTYSGTADKPTTPGGQTLAEEYTYGAPSRINSITGATLSAASTYALYNAGQIGDITNAAISSNYNVIYNATEVNTYYHWWKTFEDGADKYTANTDYRRDYTYTRNMTGSGVIGTISGGSITATGAGYQAIYNVGYIEALKNMTISTPTGKAASGSTYYPLIFNSDSRVAACDYVYTTEYNGTDAYITLYEWEYTYGGSENPATINLIDNVTFTNPQDYTIRNTGRINTIRNSSISAGKLNTVVNEVGPYATRKAYRYYSGATRWATTKYVSEVTYDYTRVQPYIGTIDNNTITAGTTTYAIRNYGHIGSITNNTISSTTTGTIYNASTVALEYHSNINTLRGVIAVGGTSLTNNYDTTENARHDVTVYALPIIDSIGEGNSISGTYYLIQNLGTINGIGSENGAYTTLSATGAGAAVYNYQGNVTHRDRIATLKADGSNNTYSDTVEYTSAAIGAIKNVQITGARNSIQNGDSSTVYTDVRIGEIGEGTECTTTGTYSAIYNYGNNAKIDAITGGIFTTGSGNCYAVYNGSTTNAIAISGGDFKGGDSTRAKAILEPDNTNRQTYPDGLTLTRTTESVTFHDGTTADGYYYIGVQLNTYTVTWKNWDGTVLKIDTEVAEGTTPSYTGDTPVREATAEYTYTFAGWTPEIAPVTGDAT
ncbi:MAG: hypothetical protein IIT70_07190, partial [Clostridia bacterium]|nr:hypothetical protein [Clostridia bacterium]